MLGFDLLIDYGGKINGDIDRPTNRVDIGQSASGRWNGRVLQYYVPNSQINAMLLIMVQGS